MHLFTALLIVAYASTTLAHPFKELCENKPAKHNFDIQSYFTGNWYLTHQYLIGVEEQPIEGACLKTKAEVLKTLIREIYLQSLPKVERHLNAENFISIAGSFKNGIGKYEGEVRLIDSKAPISESELFIPLEMTVIDTDYMSYSVVYSCIEWDLNIHGGYLVLSRQLDSEHVAPEVSVVLRRLGLKLDDFLRTETDQCKFDF